MSKKKLSDEQLEGVNGGMKIEPKMSPKFIGPLLDIIFKVKKEQDVPTPPPGNEE